jgi:DNA-binding XRE family transcriptional regulator
MTETLKREMHSWYHPDAPTFFAKGRRCSMGVKCPTFAQTGEKGKVRSTKEPAGYGEDGEAIVLCSLCDGAWRDSGQSLYIFCGIRKKGRKTSYLLPSLRRVRRSRGIVQVELAELSGCSLQTIEGAERNKSPRSVSSKMAGKLARALGVDVKELKR